MAPLLVARLEQSPASGQHGSARHRGGAVSGDQPCSWRTRACWRAMGRWASWNAYAIRLAAGMSAPACGSWWRPMSRASCPCWMAGYPTAYPWPAGTRAQAWLENAHRAAGAAESDSAMSPGVCVFSSLSPGRGLG